MAAPSYTEDLTDLATGDESTGWVEMTGSIGGNAYSAQGAPAYQDPDYPYIQGSYSVTQDCSKDTSVGSLAYNNGAGTGGHGTDGAYLVWQNYMVASNVGTYAQGGFQIIVGSGVADFDAWYVGGSDKAPYPYGGWFNGAVNTTVTADGTAGTPTATEQYIGGAVYVTTGSSKGEVHNVDVIRYGRCSAIFEFGDLGNGYATIDGFATQNDNNSNRWGLIQKTAGGYLWKGRMSLGTSTNAVDFRDSNKVIFIDWTPKVTANFNLIECINASSNIEMLGFTFICLDTTTASKGRFLMTNQCDVDLTGSTFVDMDTFVFDQGVGKTVTIDECTFRRCNDITAGGASFLGATIVGSTVAADSAALVWDGSVDPDGYLDNMVIDSTGSPNAIHAIEFDTTSATSITLRGIDFSGFNASSGQNDSAFNILRTSGTVTINLVGCSSDVSLSSSYKTAGATVVIVEDPVTTKVIAQTSDGTKVSGARVFLEADSGGSVPYQASVSITQSAGTATVSHTAHGFSTNQYVVIRGANEEEYNKVVQITVTGANSYTYSVDSGASSPATGSPVCSAVICYGLTDVNGEVTDSRTFASTQPVKGWIRKTSSAPYYKTAPLSGSISNTAGATFTGVMILDQ